MRIGLISPPAGNGNLGDEATVAAVIAALRQRAPGASLYVLSANPADTRKRHRIAAAPLRLGAEHGRRPQRSSQHSSCSGPACLALLLRAFPPPALGLRGFWRLRCSPRHQLRAVTRTWLRFRRTDLLLVTGSGVLSDHFGGCWNFPLTLGFLSLLARAAGVPFALLSVGAGPLKARTSRLLVRVTLALASYASVRDATSHRLLKSLGVRRDLPIVPDLAHGLPLNPAGARRPSAHPVVAVNLFPQRDPRYWPEPDPAAYDRYLTSMVRFLGWLLAQRYHVVLFPTQIRADVRVIDDLRRRLGAAPADHAFLSVAAISHLDDLLCTLADADFVVATRFHAILLALSLHKPVLALANHHKMTDLMEDLDLRAFVLDLKALSTSRLVERFRSLQTHADLIADRLAQLLPARRQALEQQYDEVLRLARSRAHEALVP